MSGKACGTAAGGGGRGCIPLLQESRNPAGEGARERYFVDLRLDQNLPWRNVQHPEQLHDALVLLRCALNEKRVVERIGNDSRNAGGQRSSLGVAQIGSGQIRSWCTRWRCTRRGGRYPGRPLGRPRPLECAATGKASAGRIAKPASAAVT